MEIVLGWLVFSILAAWIAAYKGRSAIGVFFLSLFLSPLIGVIVALVLTPKPTEPIGDEKHASDPRKYGTDAEFTEWKKGKNASSVKTCPFCAETVKAEAIVCKHCGKDIPRNEATINADALDKLLASGALKKK